MKEIHFKGMHLALHLKNRYYELNIHVAPMLCGHVCTIPQSETLDSNEILTDDLLSDPPDTVPAAVSRTWSLLGSLQSGQAALHLFKKHLLFWKCVCSVSHCGSF